MRRRHEHETSRCLDVRGDLDQNGVINWADRSLLASYLSETIFSIPDPRLADLDLDGRANAPDLLRRQQLLPP